MIYRRPLLLAALVAPATAWAQDIGTAQRPLRIGVTAGPHAQVMEQVRQLAARNGLVLRIIEFQDYIQPNAALAAGELDANSYQHQPFLDQQVRDRALPLVAAGKTLLFPLGIYSRQHRALAEVPAGSRIAIPNDPTNGGRALVLLATNGAFTLRPGSDFRATVADIMASSKRLRIVELDAAQLPRVLDEVAAAAINSNYALPAGLNPVRDAIALESADSPYANLIAVRRQDREASWVARLVAAYQTPAIKAFVATTFQGAVLPAF
jgi:D-methionine transport system substrate-binding protein